MESPESDFREGIIKRITGLMEQMVETGKPFYQLTEKTNVGGGRITLEESRIFLAYYKANLALYTLLESVPDMLDKDTDLRELDLRARRNVQYIDQVIAFYMTGIEQAEWLD